MSKQIRTRYVYKKYDRWWRYLPRRIDTKKAFDYDTDSHLLANFEEKMEGEPPKLWAAWLYRPITKEGKSLKATLDRLFGKNREPGKMTIFRNTADVNHELWKVKHLIDLKPLTFPNGEPTEADIPHIEVQPDGRVLIRRDASTTDIPLIDEKKGFTQGQLQGYYTSRYSRFKDVYPDTVYNPANVTILD
ncbi:unnamed protein product [Bursaphelenchus okinawaensis]|uniref:39S ribosomal protein L30, mitochondrial n=1 Tax=Bursaphelenchus okinawaensis TaxID=465554 RepID=A0A811KPU4_9BILA|nr:unnamed protein product [Bursaphelenchus okinawaensis]CAG9108239.1 unnamed protein product [Bursaphelenchus okinawaensis]